MNTLSDARTCLALNLELGGRHAASARVELLEEPGVPPVARVALRGWIDRVAERRLERALESLALRPVVRVVLDCSAVERLGGRQAARLVATVARFEGGPGAIEVCGLPPALEGRLASAGTRVRCWPSAGEAQRPTPLEPDGDVTS